MNLLDNKISIYVALIIYHMLSTLYILTHIVITATYEIYTISLHFIVEEMKAWRG